MIPEPIKTIAAAVPNAVAAVPDNLYQHIGELIALIASIMVPMVLIIFYFLKRMVGKIEKDIETCCGANTALNDRVTDVEKVLVKVGTFHCINHPGQEIQ